MSATTEARARLPIQNKLVSPAIDVVRGAVTHPFWTTDLQVAAAVTGATIARAGILQPEALWDVVVQGVTHNTGGVGREFDKGTQLINSFTGELMNALASESRPAEVVPFITFGQEKILAALKTYGSDPKMRAALEHLYRLTQSHTSLNAPWSQHLLDSAIEMGRAGNGNSGNGTQPRANFVETAVARMQDPDYGSDGERSFRNDGDYSPFAQEVSRFAAEPRVLSLPDPMRTRIHRCAQEAILNALEHADGEHLVRDLQSTLPVLHQLAPQRSVGFSLARDTASAVSASRLSAVQTLPVNPGEALTHQTSLPDANRQQYDQALGEAGRMWSQWSTRLADLRTGYEAVGSTAAVVEQEIAQMQDKLAKMPAPVQAAFIHQSLAGVRRILDQHPTRSAINFYERLHNTLQQGWQYYRRYVQLDNPEQTIAEYQAILNHDRYGVDGDMSIREHLRTELRQLAETANNVNPEMALGFFQAAQGLKTVIMAQHDQHARDFAAQIYADVANRLTRAPEAMAMNVTALPNETELGRVAEDARTAYRRDHTGESYTIEGENVAVNQMIHSARQHEAREVVRIFVDSATNETYGLDGPCQNVAVADRTLFGLVRTEVGRRNTALEAQAIFLDVSEEQILASLRTYQSRQLLTFLTETMNDAHLTAGLNRLFDMRMVSLDYYDYLAEMYSDTAIGMRAQVSATNYFNTQFASMMQRARTLGHEVEGQVANASLNLLDKVEAVSDIQTALALTRMYGEASNSANAAAYLADRLVTRLEEMRVQVAARVRAIEGLDDKARKAELEKQMAEADEQVYGALWENYFVRLASPAYGKGGRADATAILDRNMKALMLEMQKRDFVHAGAFLTAAIDKAYDRIVSSRNEDEVMRLTFYMMELATTSPIAQEMKRRETVGEGTKGTKTIGHILTDAVMKRARDDKEIIKKILVYIETRYEGPGKDEFSKPEFVMLLALWRMKMLMRMPEEGNAAGKVPGAADWIAYARATTAGIEMSLGSLKKGDDSAHLEQIIADLFVSPAAMVAFAPLNIGMKGGRKGTEAVIAAAEAALAEAQKTGKSPAEQFYAMYKTGAMAPLLDGLRVPWSAEVQRMLDLAGEYPALGKTTMETVWRYFFDFARVVKNPPGLSYVTDPEAAVDPAARAQMNMVLMRQFQTMEGMVRDRDFNFGTAPIGKSGLTKEESAALKRQQDGNPAPGDNAVLEQLAERRRLVHKTAFALLRWGMILGHSPAEEDELKTGLRQRYLELLGDIVFDPSQTNPKADERKFAPEIVTVAREVLQKCFYALTPEDVGAFFRNLMGRADRRLGQHVLVEGGNWQQLAVDVCLIPQGCERFATKDDLERGYRIEFGQEIAEVTLELLKKWRGLGGPSAIRSPIRAFVPAAELEKIGAGQSQIGLAVAEPSFPRQAVNLVQGLGDDEDRQQLAITLADIGQADLIYRAMQTKDLRPPRPAGEFITASQQVSLAAAQALSGLVREYMNTVRAMNADIGMRIEVDESGHVTGLPEYPALTARLASGADTERTQLLDAVGLTKREETAKKIGEDLFGSLEKRDPEGIARLTFALMREYGVNTDGMVQQLVQSIQSAGQVPEVSTDGSRPQGIVLPQFMMYHTPGSEGVGLMIAQLLGQSMANRAITADAVQSMLGEVLGNKEVVAGMAQAMMDAGGGTATAEAIEEMRRTMIQGVVDVLTDEQSRARLIATLRSDNEKRKVDRLSAIEKLQHDYDTAQIGMASELQTQEIDRIRRELKIISAAAEARFAAAEQALQDFTAKYPELAKRFYEQSVRPAQMLVDRLEAYQTWLDGISAPDGTLAEMADGYDRSVAAMGVTVVTPMPTPQALLQRARGASDAQSIQEDLNRLSGGSPKSLSA